MPRILSKIEGKGNGIKTVVPNMSDVAKALARPPLYITKFFGFELGAQTSTNEKTDRYIINGAHDAEKLQDWLDVFIQKFVLCKACKNPETDLVVNKKAGTVNRNCKACGQITEVDPRHKLTGVIVKNPPPKKKIRNHASAPTNGDIDGDENGEEEDGEGESDDEMFKRINAEAAQLDANQSQLQKEDWAHDMSEEAVRARTKEVEVAMSKVLVDDDDGDDADEGADENSPYDELGIWVEEQENPS
jgi:translation initiation factor 5